MEALQTLKFSFRAETLDHTKHIEDSLYSSGENVVNSE